MFIVKILNNSIELENKTAILNLIPKEDKKKYFAAKVNNRLRFNEYRCCKSL